MRLLIKQSIANVNIYVLGAHEFTAAYRTVVASNNEIAPKCEHNFCREPTSLRPCAFFCVFLVKKSKNQYLCSIISFISLFSLINLVMASTKLFNSDLCLFCAIVRNWTVMIVHHIVSLFFHYVNILASYPTAETKSEKNIFLL